jgi:uncharacterized membrane protein YhaH (DUF805 family)
MMTFANEVQYIFLSFFFSLIAILISKEVLSIKSEEKSAKISTRLFIISSVVISCVFWTALALIAKRFVFDVT